MAFQIKALPQEHFSYLFTLNQEQLAIHNAIRLVATKKPGFPCRVSLADAEIGEEVLLVHYEHHSAATPFKASHAIYVRPNAIGAVLSQNQVPDQLRTRTLSVRAFDHIGMLREADLAEGIELETAIHRLFELAEVAYIHIHYAKPGCYAALATRAIT